MACAPDARAALPNWSISLAEANIARLPRKRRRGLRGVLREMRREWTAYLFHAPGLILFAIFVVYALFTSLILSFQEWDLIGARSWVGLDNYRELLFEDHDFHEALGHTAYFVVGTVIPSTALGLGLALLLNSQIRGLGLFRTAYYLPSITPLVIASLLWLWVYHTDYGLANFYLEKLGLIDDPVVWLGNRATAMPALIVMSIWQTAGFGMLVYLAGLQAIPQEYYEAADVDGAGVWTKFWRITLPLLAPTTFFVLVINTVGSARNFTPFFVMTNGGPPGPGGATTTVGFWIYQNAFRFLRFGYAAALAYALFALLFGLSYMQFRWYRKRVED